MLLVNRSEFGSSGKILPNIGFIFNDKKFMSELAEKYIDLDRAGNRTVQKKITLFKDAMNSQMGNC